MLLPFFKIVVSKLKPKQINLQRENLVYTFIIFTQYVECILINELSKRTGITFHTIRYCENSGLINGKRIEHVRTNYAFHYYKGMIEKLELTRDGKSIGFAISEISQLIDAWRNHKIIIGKKIAVFDDKLLAIDERIKLLKGIKNLISWFKRYVASDACCKVNK
jgi:MerR family copper efflux transcriptional regulator